MCGISAVISKDTSVPLTQIRVMNSFLKHRGPDDNGVYLSEDKKIGFGHRRLSLVDLSSNGKQPMTKFNRTIIFNGEIYNFREINKELIKKGYSFFSQCDTETILTAFEEWGIECLNKFNGAFAFVIYEHTTQDTYVVRDRIGEKPLYYTEIKDSFLFASEIKAFSAFPEVTFTPNIDTIRANLIFHFFADKENTYFNNIFSLQPGYYLKIKNGLLRKQQYWDIHVDEIIEYSQEKKQIIQDIQQISEIFSNAVRIRLAADCEVGCLLSGGIDSCLITSVASHMSSYPLKCFSLHSTEYQDEDFAAAQVLVKNNKNLTHIPVTITKGVFSEENLMRATLHLEEPLLHKISLYVNTNYKIARKFGLKTVLNGQGSDEISCGYYNYYDYLHFPEDQFSLSNFASYWYEQFSFKNYLPTRVTKDLIEVNLKKNYQPYMSKDMLNSVLAFGVKTHLLNILNHEDRFSMAESVECRTVFTDYRMIEKFMRMPSKYKIFDGREKYFIRKLGGKLLPPEITNRRKMGFPNISTDLEEALVQSVIQRKDFRESMLLNQVFDRKLFSDVHNLPLMQQWKLLSLYSFEKVFFTN